MERELPHPLSIYVRLANPWSQIGLALVGLGTGMLVVALATGAREGVVPGLLLLGMAAVFWTAGRSARRQRIGMLRSGRVAEATVVQVKSSSGAGEYRQAWSMRLSFTDADGRERRTSHHADFRRGLREGARVELFFDPGTPLDTTPEGERPRVPEHRWPLLALELPGGIRSGHGGRLEGPGLLRLASVLVAPAAGLALPLSVLVRAMLR